VIFLYFLASSFPCQLPSFSSMPPPSFVNFPPLVPCLLLPSVSTPLLYFPAASFLCQLPSFSSPIVSLSTSMFTSFTPFSLLTYIFCLLLPSSPSPFTSLPPRFLVNFPLYFPASSFSFPCLTISLPHPLHPYFFLFIPASIFPFYYPKSLVPALFLIYCLLSSPVLFIPPFLYT